MYAPHPRGQPRESHAPRRFRYSCQAAIPEASASLRSPRVSFRSSRCHAACSRSSSRCRRAVKSLSTSSLATKGTAPAAERCGTLMGGAPDLVRLENQPSRVYPGAVVPFGRGRGRATETGAPAGTATREAPRRRSELAGERPHKRPCGGARRLGAADGGRSMTATRADVERAVSGRPGRGPRNGRVWDGDCPRAVTPLVQGLRSRRRDSRAWGGQPVSPPPTRLERATADQPAVSSRPPRSDDSTATTPPSPTSPSANAKAGPGGHYAVRRGEFPSGATRRTLP